jgi:hypothetical protein
MATTNDAMYTTLVALYPDAGKTLGDLLYTHWSVTGLRFRDSLQYDYYVSQNIEGYTVTRKNLVFNPNFETNILFSELAGSNLVTRSTTESYIGSASLRGEKVSFTGNCIFGTQYSANAIPVTSGQTYTGSFYVKSSVSRLASARFVWLNAAGGFISTPQGTASETSTTAWTRRFITETAPALAVSVALQVIISSVPVSEVHYIDGLLLETGSTLLPYFDGTYTDTYTGYTVASKSWDGTANNSTSTVSWNPNLTVGDLANKFWSDPDTSVSNLWDELGNNLLLEDGSFILLEVGNG